LYTYDLIAIILYHFYVIDIYFDVCRYNFKSRKQIIANRSFSLLKYLKSIKFFVALNVFHFPLTTSASSLSWSLSLQWGNGSTSATPPGQYNAPLTPSGHQSQQLPVVSSAQLSSVQFLLHCRRTFICIFRKKKENRREKQKNIWHKVRGKMRDAKNLATIDRIPLSLFLVRWLIAACIKSKVAISIWHERILWQDV